jgi:cell division protease FtsH
MIFGPDAITTGASNDIQRATEIARNMVTRFGLSDAMGPLAYAEEEAEVFLGRSVTEHRHMSAGTAREIDKQVRLIIDRNYARARDLLEANRDKLHAMAQALLQYETLSKEQIDDIMSDRPVRPPKDIGSDPGIAKGGGSQTGRGPRVAGGPVGEH